MKLTRYRKAIAAVVGIGGMIALRHFGIEIPGLSVVVLDVIVGALVSFGVYQVRNDA